VAIFNFNTTDNDLIKIDKTSFQIENIFERKNLQDALKKQIEIIAPDCLVISEEFSEWSGSKRRDKIG
jgi:3-hydroxyacyl-CoA dehydrogenase